MNKYFLVFYLICFILSIISGLIYYFGNRFDEYYDRPFRINVMKIFYTYDELKDSIYGPPKKNFLSAFLGGRYDESKLQKIERIDFPNPKSYLKIEKCTVKKKKIFTMVLDVVVYYGEGKQNANIEDETIEIYNVKAENIKMTNVRNEDIKNDNIKNDN